MRWRRWLAKEAIQQKTRRVPFQEFELLQSGNSEQVRDGTNWLRWRSRRSQGFSSSSSTSSLFPASFLHRFSAEQPSTESFGRRPTKDVRVLQKTLNRWWTTDAMASVGKSSVLRHSSSSRPSRLTIIRLRLRRRGRGRRFIKGHLGRNRESCPVRWKVYVSCCRGLEELLFRELVSLGFSHLHLHKTKGAVLLTDSCHMEAIYIINYCSRLARRVFIIAAECASLTPELLVEATADSPVWSEVLRSTTRLNIQCNSTIPSTPSILSSPTSSSSTSSSALAGRSLSEDLPDNIIRSKRFACQLVRDAIQKSLYSHYCKIQQRSRSTSWRVDRLNHSRRVKQQTDSTNRLLNSTQKEGDFYYYYCYSTNDMLQKSSNTTFDFLTNAATAATAITSKGATAQSLDGCQPSTPSCTILSSSTSSTTTTTLPSSSTTTLSSCFGTTTSRAFPSIAADDSCSRAFRCPLSYRDFDVRVLLMFDKHSRVRILVDTSGVNLDQRGYYRTGSTSSSHTTDATVASGLLYASGIYGKDRFTSAVPLKPAKPVDFESSAYFTDRLDDGACVVDPFCSDGVVLFEAAQMALKMAAGRHRTEDMWAFTKLKCFSHRRWTEFKSRVDRQTVKPESAGWSFWKGKFAGCEKRAHHVANIMRTSAFMQISDMVNITRGQSPESAGRLFQAANPWTYMITRLTEEDEGAFATARKKTTATKENVVLRAKTAGLKECRHTTVQEEEQRRCSDTTGHDDDEMRVVQLLHSEEAYPLASPSPHQTDFCTDDESRISGTSVKSQIMIRHNASVCDAGCDDEGEGGVLSHLSTSTESRNGKPRKSSSPKSTTQQLWKQLTKVLRLYCSDAAKGCLLVADDNLKRLLPTQIKSTTQTQTILVNRKPAKMLSLRKFSSLQSTTMDGNTKDSLC